MHFLREVFWCLEMDPSKINELEGKPFLGLQLTMIFMDRNKLVPLFHFFKKTKFSRTRMTLIIFTIGQRWNSLACLGCFTSFNLIYYLLVRRIYTFTLLWTSKQFDLLFIGVRKTSAWRRQQLKGSFVKKLQITC